MPSRRLLVTGGAGFIGSCFTRRILARDLDARVTVLDKLTYAGNRANLREVEGDPARARRLEFVHGDIADRDLVRELARGADAIVNFAAETHVDRSILDPAGFLTTNVAGVHALLEAARAETDRARRGERDVAPRLLQVSTDEVYGSVEHGESVESDALAPRSPYAAAKAAAELLAHSYQVTYGVDVVVTRGANTYGPYQHPEKLIPLFITNAIDDLPLPMYGDGMQRRDWLFVDDHADAIAVVLERGKSGHAYNVAGAHQTTNREVIAALLAGLGKPWSLVRTVADRPGHDRRYAMSGEKLAELGSRPRVPFDEGIARTVAWYVENEAWWRSARSGDWNEYYARQYDARLASSTAAD
ncbi:MAG TPA: dTDP-glucose 4,6-dehydratase [Candidatus Limnocylindria bacterium]|nr:dTDP-glucose 4,6-dehydratase [Candidatus Limnocylindria bacterium]